MNRLWGFFGERINYRLLAKGGEFFKPGDWIAGGALVLLFRNSPYPRRVIVRLHHCPLKTAIDIKLICRRCMPIPC
jgi:hypothetical protein